MQYFVLKSDMPVNHKLEFRCCISWPGTYYIVLGVLIQSWQQQCLFIYLFMTSYSQPINNTANLLCTVFDNFYCRR